MKLLTTFLSILLLGTLLCIAMVITIYSTNYSFVPVETDGLTQEQDDHNSKKRKLEKEVPIFSLRELAQNLDREPTPLKPITISPMNNRNTSSTTKHTENKLIDQVHINDTQRTRSETESEFPMVQQRTDKETNDSNSNETVFQSEQMVIQQPQQCEPRINIVLLKTHKTGSSTMQNILYRFGDTRGLSFVLPPVDVYMGSPELFRSRFAIPSAFGYNILANHARYHKENMAKIMPAGTKYISIVRFPPNQFESMYSYYGFESKYHASLEQFAKRPHFYYTKFEGLNPRHSGLNPVLYDLGLRKGDLVSPDKVDEWIKFIDESFDLILIAEYLYESLILLKELMCWSWDDITFFSSNKRNDSLVKEIPNNTVHQLLEWHSGDYKLYLHFNRTLHRKIKNYGVSKMQNDVELLKRKNEEMKEKCLEGTKPVTEMGGKTVIDRYVLKPSAKNNLTCARMTYSAFNYLNILRHKQKLKKPGVR